MSSTIETHEFQTEARELLDLMIHSIYSQKDIFLRELISNSSDALDKLRFEGLQNKDLMPEGDLEIWLIPDVDERTLTICDNGIGMSRDEVVSNIGTIAKSGTKEFLKKIKEGKAQADSPELIGQFGVGFYSSFMVAETVTLTTRKAGEESATRWTSQNDGGYTLEEVTKETAGTEIVLKLRPEDKDNGIQDYTLEWPLREIVKRYSDFVSYPIKMNVTRSEPVTDDEGKPIEGESKSVTSAETLNSMKAIWTKSRSEVEDEEYAEFYKHLSHDWNAPADIITLSLEGTYEAKALLFLPSKAPGDMFFRDTKMGVNLYVKRVFIKDDCKELLPEYLRFVKGVVDAEDLSLNVSREILQHDRQIKVIRKRIVKKVLQTLKEKREEKADDYKTFWGEFGPVLKEGLIGPNDNKEAIFDLIEVFSTHEDAKETTSMKDYVSRLQEDQEDIYFLTAPSLETAKASPHLESFKAKGIEVLLLTDKIDEIWSGDLAEYDGHKLISVGKGEVEPGTEEEKKKSEEDRKKRNEESKDLLSALQKPLDEDIKEVRVSDRLTESPVRLVSDDSGMTPQLEAMMRQMGNDLPKMKRILEINPSHPVFARAQALFEENKESEEIQDFSKLLFGQAVLAEGAQLDDPAGFAKLVAKLMAK